MARAARKLAHAISLAAIACGLFWLVAVYASALRDPRFLDGWILAAGVGLAIAFHVAIKSGKLAPKAAVVWRNLHLFVGYVLIAAFVSHVKFALPDSSFGWLLCSAYGLVTASGLFGTYLAWSMRRRRGLDASLTLESIPSRSDALAAKALAVIAASRARNSDVATLPTLPHDDWIEDLYKTHLAPLFEQQSGARLRLSAEMREFARVAREIETLSSFVDTPGRETLDALKSLVLEMQNLERAESMLTLAKAWTFVHVPATYALIVLGVVHVLAVYAFSSGTW